jgi:hypothetical protein
MQHLDHKAFDIKVATPCALGDVHDFVECCEQQAWFYAEGWVTLQKAVDNLQYLAERWGLIEEIGRDAVQEIMAFSTSPSEMPANDDAGDLVRQWELADPRDAWKHTSEAPPPKEVRNADISGKLTGMQPPYRTPSATIDAFRCVVALDDVVRLKSWLADRPKDASFLLELLESASC